MPKQPITKRPLAELQQHLKACDGRTKDGPERRTRASYPSTPLSPRYPGGNLDITTI